MNKLETEKDLEPGIDYPSVVQILGIKEETHGEIDVPEHSRQKSFYEIKKGNNGKIEVMFRVSSPKDPSWRNITTFITVDSSGSPLNGYIDAVTPKNEVSRVEIRPEQMIKVLKYFQPVVEQTKKDEVSRKELEHLKSLPQLPGSLLLPLVGLPSRNLDEYEMKRNPYILFDSKKQLPQDALPLPREDHNVYVHTDTCSIAGQFIKTLFHTPYGATVFYFPRLSQGGKKRAPLEDGDMNTYYDAVVFPKSHRNADDILRVWNRAYFMVRDQKATDKEVYSFMFEQAQRIEKDAKRANS